MLTAIVDEINARAEPYLLRRLQEIRQRLGKKHTKKLLHTEKRFVEKGWTFHIGGRTELQFNVGLEPLEGKDHLRHGVAFSFEPSRDYPSNDLIKVLRPKVERFNEFVRYSDEFLDLRMWHWRKIRRQDKRSERPDRMPSPIQPELVAPGVFVFLGQLQPMEAIDYEVVLDDFDRLLPLYEFVEGTSAFPTLTPAGNGFHFQ